MSIVYVYPKGTDAKTLTLREGVKLEVSLIPCLTMDNENIKLAGLDYQHMILISKKLAPIYSLDQLEAYLFTRHNSKDMRRWSLQPIRMHYLAKGDNA